MSDLLRPVETTVDGYPACHWPMQEYPPPRARAHLLHMQAHEEAMGWGFHEAVMVNVANTTIRELRLLGPDSPAEYCYPFDRREIDVRFLDDRVRDMVWFIRRWGLYRKVYANGPIATDLSEHMTLNKTVHDSGDCQRQDAGTLVHKTRRYG